jgi:hypothetical protein
MAKVVQFGLRQKQLARTPVLEFFGHVNVVFRPRAEYQCWSSENFALADQKWGFLLLLAESYEFSSNSVVLFGFFRQIDAMSFILHILLVDNVNKLVNMGLMENLMDFRWWDKPVLLLMALVPAGVTLRLLLPT